MRRGSKGREIRGKGKGRSGGEGRRGAQARGALQGIEVGVGAVDTGESYRRQDLSDGGRRRRGNETERRIQRGMKKVTKIL